MMTTKTPAAAQKPTISESKTEEKILTDQKPSIKRFQNDKLMLTTLVIAIIITFLIYTVPDWVFLEIPTRNIISTLLDLLGIENYHIPTSDPNSVIPIDLRGGTFPFLEATSQTPGIHIPSTNGDYWIVKACTGMQAGGLLIAIILVSEASWDAKIRASFMFFLTLFIGNALRIAFHLWCVSFLVTQFNMNPEEAFYWAHDVSSKVIGFFGTILFAFVIERMGVPIIDQFADWLDYIWWRLKSVFSTFFS
jgi:exosortase/archaeosortase family protein